MRTVKADLHMHGPIGFQPYWLKVQGYSGKNLLQHLADRCFEREIGICAVTSESDAVDDNGVILRNTPHDRLGFLANNYISALPRGYDAGKFGGNSLVVAKDGKFVYFVNG